MRYELRIDLSYAKNALFVRQTIAAAFGVPLGREFTWEILHSLICYPENPALPKSILVEGFSQLSVRVPDEEKNLRNFLRQLREVRPDIQVGFVLHT
jgi:hypothetical protein